MGTRGNDRYAGWLQVADADAGMSETTVHLSIQDDERVAQSDFDVPGELEQALQRLADDVTTQAGGSSAGERAGRREIPGRFQGDSTAGRLALVPNLIFCQALRDHGAALR
jgi:hypothetical protein